MNHDLFRTLLRRILPRPPALALAAALIAGTPTAMAAIDIRLDGLPAGLTASVTADLVRCNGNGTIDVGVAGANLTENTTVMWVQVPRLTGGFTLQQRTFTSYHGQLSINALPSSGCSFGNAVKFRLNLMGESATGNPTYRSAVIWTTSSPLSMSTLHHTIEAKTLSLTYFENNVGASPVTSTTRGTWNRWSSMHSNSMGSSSTVDPTLDFLVPGPPQFLGIMQRVARITVTQDRRVCIVASTTVCRARSEGGVLSHANIDVGVSDTVHNPSSPSTQWSFRLAPGFRAGTVTVRVAADDLDPASYLVDGEPTELNLLPWKPLSVPVLVN